MMAKFKVVRFGDARGIGAIVEEKPFFGRKKTWTLVPGEDKYGNPLDDRFMDFWVCRETAERNSLYFSDAGRFYKAMFLSGKDEANAVI